MIREAFGIISVLGGWPTEKVKIEFLKSKLNPTWIFLNMQPSPSSLLGY